MAASLTVSAVYNDCILDLCPYSVVLLKLSRRQEPILQERVTARLPTKQTSKYAACVCNGILQVLVQVTLNRSSLACHMCLLQNVFKHAV